MLGAFPAHSELLSKLLEVEPGQAADAKRSSKLLCNYGAFHLSIETHHIMGVPES